MANSKEPPDGLTRVTGMQIRGIEVAEKMLAKIEARFKDPDYKPNPTDLIGVFQAISAMQGLVITIPAVQARLETLRSEIDEMESRLLGLLQKL